MKKKISAGSVFLYGVVILFLAMFLFITIDGANKVSDVYTTGSNAVSLKATISSYDERTEFDEGYESTSYDLFVSYEYEGKSYSDVRYDNSYRKPKLGKEVTVKIDPKNPGELLPDAAEYNLSLVLSPIFLSLISLVCYITLRDFFSQRTNSENAKTLAFALIAGLMLFISWLHHNAVGTWVYLGFCVAAFGLMCLYLYLHSRKSAAAKEEQ